MSPDEMRDRAAERAAEIAYNRAVAGGASPIGAAEAAAAAYANVAANWPPPLPAGWPEPRQISPTRGATQLPLF